MDTHHAGEQKAYAPSGDNTLRYLLYLPPGFDAFPENQWPVLCFLHGRGEAGRDQDGNEQPIEVLLKHGAPPWHCAINSPLIRDFIVVSPQLPERYAWAHADFISVMSILRHVHSDFRGDPRKTLLTGFSLGGKATFDFADWAAEMADSDPARRISWAALWPVDDAHDQARTSSPVRRIWLHFGTWRPDPHRESATNLGLAEASAFHPTERLAERLYTDYSPYGYDHATTCAVAYADWRVYDWFLRSEDLL